MPRESTEMNFSALYVHELHQRLVTNPLNPYFDNPEDAHARQMWATPNSPDSQNTKSPEQGWVTPNSPGQRWGSSTDQRFTTPENNDQSRENYLDTRQMSAPQNRNQSAQSPSPSGYKSIMSSNRTDQSLSHSQTIELQPMTQQQSETHLGIPQVQGPYGPTHSVVNQGSYGGPAHSAVNQGMYDPAYSAVNQGSYGSPAHSAVNQGSYGPAHLAVNQGSYGPTHSAANQEMTISQSSNIPSDEFSETVSRFPTVGDSVTGRVAHDIEGEKQPLIHKDL